MEKLLRVWFCRTELEEKRLRRTVGRLHLDVCCLDLEAETLRRTNGRLDLKVVTLALSAM
jgi:hypothetical protein